MLLCILGEIVLIHLLLSVLCVYAEGVSCLTGPYPELLQLWHIEHML